MKTPVVFFILGVFVLVAMAILGNREAVAHRSIAAEEKYPKIMVRQKQDLLALARGEVISGQVTNSDEMRRVDNPSTLLEADVNSAEVLSDLSGMIAYGSTRNNTGVDDLFVQDVETNDVFSLVTSNGNDLMPVWSPSGKELVFASDRDGDFEVYLRMEDGTEKNLTNNSAEDIHPSWSPDGQRIIFSSDQGGDYFQAYTMDLIGQNVSQIGEVPDNNALYPRYSPDGGLIAFMRASVLIPACDWDWDIWLMGTDGQNQRRLTTQLGGDLYPEWTPTGDVIYASCRNFVDSDLYISDLETGGETKLTGGFLSNEWAAVYSPAGDYIAFNSNSGGNAEVYVMPAGGGVATNVSQDPAEDLLPSWTETFVPQPPNPNRELAERFAPVIYSHKDDVFHPISVIEPLSWAHLFNQKKNIGPLWGPELSDLMTTEWNSEFTYIDLAGEPGDTLNTYRDNYFSRVEDAVYARVYRDSARGFIVVQYWFFYYDNLWINHPLDFEITLNHHEGDWEMAQVVLSENEEPLYAVFSQHGQGSRRLWQYLDLDGEHMHVYPASGSHASYFRPYDYLQRIPIDHAGPSSRVGILPVIMLPELLDEWPFFKGHWGDDGGKPDCVPGIGDLNDGPRGPTWSSQGFTCDEVELKDVWIDPISWSQDKVWDEDAHHNKGIKVNAQAPMPFDVHIYQLPSLHHVGWRDGHVEIEIADAEYIENPASGKRTILLHEVNPEDPLYKVVYWVRSTAALDTTINDVITAPVTFTLSLPDYQNGIAISATYALSGTWGVNSTGTITVTENGHYNLVVDLDGNGSADEIHPPVTLETAPIDILPPGTVADLMVVASGVSTTTLRWTAPGDDGLEGKALAYDIRYYHAPLTASNWVSATQILNPPMPTVGGTQQQLTITGLPAGTYYFAIRAIDDAFLQGPLSNSSVAKVVTLLHLPIILR